MGFGTGSIGAGGAISACGAGGGAVETGGTRVGIIVLQDASATVNASAMARNNSHPPGYSYNLSDKDFGKWDYVVCRYYHRNCRF